VKKLPDQSMTIIEDARYVRCITQRMLLYVHAAQVAQDADLTTK